MKLKYLSLLLAIIGVLLLYFLSRLSHPPLIDINEMPDYEGKQVTIEGVVTDYRATRQGSQIITIKSNNATATVFAEGKRIWNMGIEFRQRGKYKNTKTVGN